MRNPVFAIDSLRQTRRLRGEKQLSWPNLALIIRQFQKLHDRVGTLAGDRFLWVRYESLVAEPDVVMRRIADWLDIPFEPCLTEPTMLGNWWPGLSSFAATKGIESTPARREIMTLSPREVDVIRKHLAAFNDTFGYGN